MIYVNISSRLIVLPFLTGWAPNLGVRGTQIRAFSHQIRNSQINEMIKNKNELPGQATRFESGRRRLIHFSFFIPRSSLFGGSAEFGLRRNGIEVLLEQGGRIGVV